MAQKADRFAPLQMDNAEICTMYKEAKSKIKEIGILAEINATSKGRIINILFDNGADVTPAVIDTWGWAETKEKLRARMAAEQARREKAAAEAVGAPEPEEEPAADYEQQPEPGQLPAAEEKREPVPAPMTVGALRDQLFGLPEDAPVLLGGSAPIRSVTFVREFNAATGSTVSQVMID